MNINSLGIADLFDLLESNKLGEVEEIKKVFHDLFLCTKDAWLVNGLFDYYLSTNSSRAVEVLVGVREPHDKHLLDRLSEVLSKSGSSGQRIRTLTLLGHIARRQPIWLYKLASHTLFRELLKLLKVETDTLSLISALFLLAMLLPMLPAALGPYLSEIFEVFGRLASYYHHQSLTAFSTPAHLSSAAITETIDKNNLYLLHLQMGLYSLFHRLYAMYPCNFISYLKQQYVQRDQLATFAHTIRPMLDSVRMHPLLVTASKDTEVSAARWKKMEHHDVMAECGRFTLDKCREEVFRTANSRFTPPLDYSSACTPISVGGIGGMATWEISNGDEDTFWSPSMTVTSQSPQFPTGPVTSAPSTPNNNSNNNINNNNSSTNVGSSNNSGNRTGTSPPEAAVEATPETTPVKDLRKRQVPAGSAAVRALSAFSNGAIIGASSRPSTPILPSNNASASASSMIGSGDANNAHGFLSHKLSKIIAERQTSIVDAATTHSQQKSSVTVDEYGRLSEADVNQNGKNDSWQEDQEILEIVNCQSVGKFDDSKHAEQQGQRDDEKLQNAFTNLSQTVYLRLYSQSHAPAHCTNSFGNILRKSKSCSDIKVQNREIDRVKMAAGIKRSEEAGTQTFDLLPYERLLLGICEQKSQMNSQNSSLQGTGFRLSPTGMLDRYVQACTRASNYSGTSSLAIEQQQQKPRKDNDGETDQVGEEDTLDVGSANRLLQLMQMQLQFERQRREVHAERNRRLLGKLRDSTALEEHNYALADRLKLMEKEVEGLKAKLERNKKEASQSESRYKETLQHWQTKCVDQERQNKLLKDRLDSVELDLTNERKKVVDCEQRIRSAEASLFDAGHQLRVALKAANQSKELERMLDVVQKKLLLLGEAQAKLQESTAGISPMTKQEASQIQKSYAEELNGLRRQLESRTSHVEALKIRLTELENKEARKEAQLVEMQRLLQETKDQHEAELEAVESKYKAQAEINLLLEGRILELHGTLEAATSSVAAANNLASSASPKERSPPLSASLASSSEGSLAFIHSGTGIILNDCCDTAAEIPNLQAMVEPAPSQATSPSRQSQQRPISRQD